LADRNEADRIIWVLIKLGPEPGHRFVQLQGLADVIVFVGPQLFEEF